MNRHPAPEPDAPDDRSPAAHDATTDEAVVELAGVRRTFGTVVAVESLDLCVPRGSIFGVIGPNGAGKSTTFSIVSTLLRPSAGTVQVLGIDALRSPREVRRRLGYMPDQLGVYDTMTVVEYLEFFAGAYGIDRRARRGVVDGLLELVELTDKERSPVQTLSRGMKQRLSLARSLVNDPELLVLDEPASGLDPRARVELRHLLVKLRDLGKTIVVSSHILAELDQVCSEVAIMQSGRVIAQGTPAAIGDALGGRRRIVVRFSDGTEEHHEVTDDREQHALLRRLMRDDQRAVLEFTRLGTGLEDLFMTLTARDLPDGPVPADPSPAGSSGEAAAP